MLPGEIMLSPDDIRINDNLKATDILLANTGDRVIYIGSHTPFNELNAALNFDREQAQQKRLDIPAGSLFAMHPGAQATVALIPINPT